MPSGEARQRGEPSPGLHLDRWTVAAPSAEIGSRRPGNFAPLSTIRASNIVMALVDQGTLGMGRNRLQGSEAEKGQMLGTTVRALFKITDSA